MLKHQIGGLPVLDEGKLVGIITTSDVMHAFLEVTGAATPGSVRIDLAQNEKGGDLAEAVKLVNEIGGEVLGVGTYRDPWSEQPIFYLRLRGVDAAAASTTLQNKGYTVLSVH
jgi:acetoin utilization protein AcuB